MGPKIRKPQKAKGEEKRNIDENIDEVDRLMERLEEAEIQVREEKKVIDRLTRENIGKDEKNSAMQLSFSKEIEKYIYDIDIAKEEANTQKQLSDHTIEVLSRRVNQLEINMDSCSVLEKTNISLRNRVDELMIQLEKEGKEHTDEICNLRQDFFNHKMSLGQTFRKTLQEFDQQYKKNAFEAMSEESKNALTANAKLKEELFLQSIGVENLLYRFKTQGGQYHKMKVENEILEKGSSLRIKEIAYLKKDQYEKDKRIDELKTVIEQNQAELPSDETKSVQDIKQQLDHYKALFEKSQEKCTKWKNRAMTFIKTQGKPRTVASQLSKKPNTASFIKHDAQNDYETRLPLEINKKINNPSTIGFIEPFKPAEYEIDTESIWRSSTPSPAAIQAMKRPNTTLLMNRATSAPLLNPVEKINFNIPISLGGRPVSTIKKRPTVITKSRINS